MLTHIKGQQVREEAPGLPQTAEERLRREEEQDAVNTLPTLHLKALLALILGLEPWRWTERTCHRHPGSPHYYTWVR